MSLKAVIIDDEQHARENLSMLVSEYCEQITVVGMGHDIESGLRIINETHPEVVFLDIRMPSGAEGFELLQHTEHPDFMVVFVTAFKDYAIDAFKVNAVDYILKPIDIDELTATADRLVERKALFKDKDSEAEQYRNRLEKLSAEMAPQVKRLAISHSTGIKLVLTKDISYLQAEGNCTRLGFRDQSTYLDTRTLKRYEEMLAGSGFLRVHRSYIINLDELREFSRQEGTHVMLSGGEKIPVSRSQISALLNHLNRL